MTTKQRSDRTLIALFIGTTILVEASNWALGWGLGAINILAGMFILSWGTHLLAACAGAAFTLARLGEIEETGRQEHLAAQKEAI